MSKKGATFTMTVNQPPREPVVDLSEGDSNLSPQRRQWIETAIDECDRFYPAFQFVLWGDKSPRSALESAMVDALGEA